MGFVAPAIAAIGSAMGTAGAAGAAGTAAAGAGTAAAGTAAAGTAAAGLGAGTAAGLGAGAGTAAGLSAGAGTAGTLGMAAGAGTAVPLAASTAAGTGAGLGSLASSAAPAAASSVANSAASAGSAGSGFFNAVIGGAKQSLGSMNIGGMQASNLFGSEMSMGQKIGTLGGNAIKSKVTGELNKVLNPTATASPMIGTAQAPTGMDTAAAQNRPQSAGAGSFQANIGPGYQVGDAQLAKISGLSDEEAALLQRIASGNSGLSSLMG